MEAANRTAVSNEIETLLIIHEKKGGLPTGPIPGQRNESSSSDSEEETPKYSTPSHNTGKLRYMYMQVHTEVLISSRHILNSWILLVEKKLNNYMHVGETNLLVYHK